MALVEIDKCEPVAWMYDNKYLLKAELTAPVYDIKTPLYTSPQPIEKCEPVGELILDPVFLPALKAPLVNWKINLVDLEVGTKFYTSPQPRDCEPVITNTKHGFVMTDRNFTYAGNGYIHDNNFDHDAALKISGDFAEGDLDKYAQMIVKHLNTKG